MAFFHGLLLALGLILPLGVQNVFIFNQGAVQPRFLKAIPAVITAGLCDTLLILMAVLGVSVAVLKFSSIKIILLTIGIIFLVYMGIITWRNNNGGITGEKRAFSTKKQIIFAASVSLLNPHAIMDTIGVIGISSLKYNGFDKFLFTFATISASFVWFLFLSISGRLVQKVGGKIIPILNKLSAIIMWASAVYLILSFT